jgi:hypothetical protein
MLTEAEKLDKIRAILLKHRGKANSIKSKTIALMIGIDEDDTHVQTRGLITKLFKAGLPVGAWNSGYFLIETQDEIDEYCETLNSRIEEVYDRLGRLQSNFDRFYDKKRKIKRNPVGMEDADIL